MSKHIPFWLYLMPVAACLYLIYLLLPILTPFICAAILAYIVQPLAVPLEKRFSCTVSAFLLVLFVCSVVALGVLLLIPMWIKQAQALWERLPILIVWLKTHAIPYINGHFGIDFSFLLDIDQTAEFLSSNFDTVKNAMLKSLPILTSRGVVLLGYLLNIVLIPILFFYFLCERGSLKQRIFMLVPPRWQHETRRISHRVNRVLGEFLHGQLLVMLIMAGIYSVGWGLVGLQSGVAIGVMTGILVFIPYLGAIMGIGLAMFAALLQGEGVQLLFAVGGVYVIGQLLESYLITPYLVGERIGLSPLEVIFALMAFGELFGFVGVMVALPLAAIMRVLFIELCTYYHRTRFYTG